MSEMCDLLTIFKNKFRKIENLTKKCVNLEGAIKYFFKYIQLYSIFLQVKCSSSLYTEIKEHALKCIGNIKV